MAMDIVSDILLSLFGLLQGSLVTSVPVFVLVLLGSLLKEKIQKKYPSLKWLQASAVSTFILLFVLIFIMYYSPVVSSIGQETIGTIPPQLSPDLTTFILTNLFVFLRLVFVVAVLTLIILPLELIGSFIHDSLKGRFPELNRLIIIYASVFASTVIAALLAIWLLPLVLGIDVITGVLFFIYFGG